MLRLLHSSDWHLGQLLREQERSYEHQQFLSWLLAILAEREIDVLLIAGDVFDVANPPAAAQRRFYEFIAAARTVRTGLQIVVVAGNHDSPSRLEAPSALVEALGVSVVGRVPWRETLDSEGAVSSELALDEMLIELRSNNGRVEAWCLAVPFLRPGDVPRIDSERDAYALGIAALYRQLLELARERRVPGQAIVAMGHAAVFSSKQRTSTSHVDADVVSAREESSCADVVSAAEESSCADEERGNEAIRPIVLGGLERLDERLFSEDLAYVALGHLHRAGCVGARAEVRYSGSPLPLSFAERTYRHQVVYVELDGEHASHIEAIAVPRFVGMLRIPAAPAPLNQVLEALRNWSPDDEQRRHPIWLEVAVAREQAPVFDLVAQIEEALRDKPVCAWRLIERAHRATEMHEPAPLVATSIDEVQRMLDPEQLLAVAWTRAYRDVPLPQELLDSLREIMLAGGDP